jgi:hypothetical protein
MPPQIRKILEGVPQITTARIEGSIDLQYYRHTPSRKVHLRGVSTILGPADLVGSAMAAEENPKSNLHDLQVHIF